MYGGLHPFKAWQRLLQKESSKGSPYNKKKIEKALRKIGTSSWKEGSVS